MGKNNLKRIQSFIRKNEILFTILIIFIIGAVSYLPYIRQMGVYHDDWKLYTAPNAGITYSQLFASDRPGIGILQDLIFPVLGFNPFTYHIYTFFLRFLGTLVFLWLTRLLFPERKLETMIMAILFFVFPGFFSEANAITFSNQFLTLLISLLSITLTLKTILAKKALWRSVFFVLALLTAAIYPFIIEYYIGLEVVRVILIFYLKKQINPEMNIKRIIKNSIIAWLPYVIILLAFLFWRFFIFNATRTTTNAGAIISDYVQNPVLALSQLLIRWLRGTFDSMISVWSVPLHNSWSKIKLISIIKSLALAIFSIVLIVFFIVLIDKRDRSIQKAKNPNFSFDAIILGGLIVVITLFPIALFDREVGFVGNLDRYTVPALIGSVMLIIGFVNLIYQYRIFWTISISLLIFISVVTQGNYTGYERDYWQVQRNFWWQLSWRAPQLKKGTVIVPYLASNYPFMDVWEIFTPANLIYYPGKNNFSITAEILNEQTANTIISEKAFDITRRDIEYTEDLSKSLVVAMPVSSGCIHIIDSRQIELPIDAEMIISAVAGASKINQILINDEEHTPPKDIFGAEPSHTWCYYYQKASLARQKIDWNAIAQLGFEVTGKRLHPNDPSEWMPFLEGYANLGAQKEVDQILTIIKSDPDIQYQLCNELQTHPEGVYSTGQIYQSILNDVCSKK